MQPCPRCLTKHLFYRETVNGDDLYACLMCSYSEWRPNPGRVAYMAALRAEAGDGDMRRRPGRPPKPPEERTPGLRAAQARLLAAKEGIPLRDALRRVAPHGAAYYDAARILGLDLRRTVSVA